MKQNKVPKNEYIRKPVGKTNPYKHDVDYVSAMGYRDDSPFNDRPYIDIHTPSGMIDMSNTGIPLMANGMYLPPYSGMHQFEPGIVREQKIPMAQDGWESRINNYLGNPLGRAQQMSTTNGKENDALRHAYASMYSSENAGPFIANALGLGHEIMGQPNSMKEHAGDIYNNFVGSMVGALPFVSTSNKEKAIKKLHKLGLLSSGTKAYGGGLLNKTLTCPSCGWSWKAVDGGTDITTCHKCGSTVKLAYGGLHKAQKGEQVEDNDSWLENIAEIVDPTGISSWDDMYRAYKNSGVGKELALEALGAIPFLGKVSKVTKPGIHLTKYSGIDQILKNTLPRNKSLSRAADVTSKTGRGTDAVQAVLGAKDDSGFTWDIRHGEVPKYGGRNIFPQIDLGEHGDYAYGGDPSLPNIEGHYPFGGIHTKTHTHMKEGGWLDQYQTRGEVKPIYVTDPNDYRLRAYNDSLWLHQNNLEPLPKPKIATYNKEIFGKKLDGSFFLPPYESQYFTSKKSYYPDAVKKYSNKFPSYKSKQKFDDKIIYPNDWSPYTYDPIRGDKPIPNVPTWVSRLDRYYPYATTELFGSNYVGSHALWPFTKDKKDDKYAYYSAPRYAKPKQPYILKEPGKSQPAKSKVIKPSMTKDKSGRPVGVIGQTIKDIPKALPNKKEEAATISADYLPMIQTGMPDMVSREPEIMASPTSRPSSTNNRISWRMDPETRKMVPVYLEGKTQKVKEGKRLYNKNIPSSTAAIPADFVPQFEPDGNKDVVSKKMGGWLDKYQGDVDGSQVMPDEDGWLSNTLNTIYAKLNPYNWGVPDYSGGDGIGKFDWSVANRIARARGDKEFMHNNKRYAVKDKRKKEDWETAEEKNPEFFKNYAKNYLKSVHPEDYEKRYKDLLSTHYRYGNPYVTIEKPGLGRSGNYGRAYFGTDENQMHIYGLKQNPNITKIDTVSLMNDYVQELLHARQLKDLGHEGFSKHTDEDYKRNNVYYEPSTKKWVNYDETMYTDPKSIEGVHMTQGNNLWNRLLMRRYPLEEDPDFNNTRKFFLKKYKDKKFHPYEDQHKLRTLQRALSEEGYDMSESLKKDGTYDGIYGEQTKNALYNWQKGYTPTPVKKSNVTISAAPTYNKKYGGWLDKYQGDISGSQVMPSETTQSFIPANLKNKLDQLKKQDPKYKQKLAQEKKFYDDVAKAEEDARKKEIADRKARIANSIKAQDEKIIGNPNWREVLARQTQATGDKLRISDEPNFFDDYVNPAAMIGSMATGLGQAPYQAQQQDSYMPYLTGIGMPLVMGALAGLGAKSTGQFINNIVNPLAGLEQSLLNRGKGIISKKPGFLTTQEELAMMNADDFPRGVSTPAQGNQLPPPPSEIIISPSGESRPVWQQIPISDDPPMTSLANINPETYSTMRNRLIQRMERPRNYSSPQFYNDITTGDPDLSSFVSRTVLEPAPEIKTNIKNISGLTQEDVLARAASKDKDKIAKMSETEFKNTVLSPNGEIITYKKGPEVNNITYDMNTGRMVLRDQNIIPDQDFVDLYNSNLARQNEIIASKNKSGVQYKIKGLKRVGSSNTGHLTFETPEQIIPRQRTEAAVDNYNAFQEHPEIWAEERAGLRQNENGSWQFNEEVGMDAYSSKEAAMKALSEAVEDQLGPMKKLSGESVWAVDLYPGKWQGNVEDIANQEYYKSIPGLGMHNTMATAFADNTVRRGSKTYEAINDYLKEMGMGRVKPGFNSQSQYALPAWEDFVKKGKAFGYYGDPKTVYGSMKSMLPYLGLGYLGYEGMQDDGYRRGGSLYTPPNLKKKSKSKGTSKNIQSSINSLFARNFDLYGSSNKAMYNPNSKYKFGGGWLDNLD